MTSGRRSSDDLSLIREGLPRRAETARRVIVVGAGMAGLVAAYELLRAGHDPLILEARKRVGGRIRTLREPFSHGLYAEAGAMRIPESHHLTLAYVEKWGLEIVPFTMDNRSAYCYVQGQRRRLEDIERMPDGLGFDVSQRERGKTAARLWREAIEPIARQLREGGEAAWPDIIDGYDKYSLREFLQSRDWSEGAIEMFGVLLGQEAMMNSSFLELLREEVGEYYSDMVQLVDGMDRLPQAFLPALRERIRFGARMTAIDQDRDSVTIQYRTLAGRRQVTGDYAIVTTPFAVLRRVEAVKPFSHGKRRAIRQLHYDSATKVFLQSRRRFWEEDDGIFGGATVTDLAIRNIYYPEHGRDTGRGVLLAGYTWSADARQWGALAPGDRIAQALRDVSKIHPQMVDEFEGGASVVWDQDEFAGGAFAVFDPNQERLLFRDIVAPEGRVHFAGEHTTRMHAWIQGAVASGLRAARAVHEVS